MLHSNITSKRERNPLYLPEIEEPLRNHPACAVYLNAGTSINPSAPRKAQISLDSLERSPAIAPACMSTLSWTMLQPYLLDTDGKYSHSLGETGQALARFMLSFDVVGHFDGLADSVTSFKTGLLDALPRRSAHQVAHDLPHSAAASCAGRACW